MDSFDRDVSDAILEASCRQARENLDLDGIFGGPRWAPELFTGSASRNGLFEPRFETVIATEDGRPLLVCSRLSRNDDGHERGGVTLEDIIGYRRD